MFTVYILYSEKFNKTYTGFTSDLEQRIKSHNKLANKFWTVRFRPWKLIYTEVYKDKQKAMQREKELKTGMGRDFIKGIVEAYKY